MFAQSAGSVSYVAFGSHPMRTNQPVLADCPLAQSGLGMPEAEYRNRFQGIPGNRIRDWKERNCLTAQPKSARTALSTKRGIVRAAESERQGREKKKVDIAAVRTWAFVTSLRYTQQGRGYLNTACATTARLGSYDALSVLAPRQSGQRWMYCAVWRHRTRPGMASALRGSMGHTPSCLGLSRIAATTTGARQGPLFKQAAWVD